MDFTSAALHQANSSLEALMQNRITRQDHAGAMVTLAQVAHMQGEHALAGTLHTMASFNFLPGSDQGVYHFLGAVQVEDQYDSKPNRVRLWEA